MAPDIIQRLKTSA